MILNFALGFAMSLARPREWRRLSRPIPRAEPFNNALSEQLTALAALVSLAMLLPRRASLIRAPYRWRYSRRARGTQLVRSGSSRPPPYGARQVPARLI